MKFSFSILVLLFSFGLSAQTISSGYVDYLIKIEVGRENQDNPTEQVQFIEANNRTYFNNKVGLTVSGEGNENLKELKETEKMLIWRKGKNSYKHEAKDSNCCLLYSNLKDRYKVESTKLTEMILGHNCHKVLIYDEVNKENYRVWFTHRVKGGISPIGYLPLPGMVLKLESDRVTYQATQILFKELASEYFDVPSQKLKFSEKAFRSGFIP